MAQPANSMKVVILRAREIKQDHPVDVRVIQASCSDIRCNYNMDLSVRLRAKSFPRIHSLFTVQAPVKVDNRFIPTDGKQPRELFRQQGAGGTTIDEDHGLRPSMESLLQ
eukprot:CAMPEP_0184688414 /NCGR_PEP_ID=MMETSP0312-20130426/29820_1 /TAXON_ID=31354 /ORGANISM="Compsopogon coeruleus, Strain SAG 36.94" /LENGTH=109 /DNA_ID=CAMNT_0027145557 /DNA_START=604 /DNA_END=933 /DNA_ORIENTATION=+